MFLSPFWHFQLTNLWEALADTATLPRLGRFVGSARDMWYRHQSATSSPSIGEGVPEDEKLTVIILNHKRPANVGQIARYALRSGFVGRVILSNNSQAYPISRYVALNDPRLVLLDHATPSGVGISFEIARDHPSGYYLRIDDDIFLHPGQLQWIYWALRHASDRPHGIFGAAHVADGAPDSGWPFVHRRYQHGAIDVLNGLFAFTAAHLREYFRLCECLGITDQKTFMNGEDIVLSFSGERRPLIHHVGAIWECASEAKPGVALHQSRPRFYEERWRLFQSLKALKHLADG